MSKKVFLESFANFTRKNLHQSPFLSYNFLKKESIVQFFPVKFFKFLGKRFAEQLQTAASER